MNNKIKDDNEFRNNIDLMFLTNYAVINNKEKEKETYKIDGINNHKTFILNTIRKLLKNEFIDSKVNDSFKIFAESLIEYKNFTEMKNVIQQQYKNLEKEKKKTTFKPIDIGELDISIVGKKKETKKIDLNKFVKKKKVKKKKKVVMPKKHNFK
tara:strand:- start:3350 stop:3811 length:462 start_codon:yes stop_codon:yes gene_type:complete